MSKALEIADFIDNSRYSDSSMLQLAAAELRRLHEINAEFVAVCERVSNLGASPSDIAIMNRLIAKAKEQA